MSLLSDRVVRRLSFVGRLADLLLVIGLLVRVAQRQGWLPDEHGDFAGFDDDPDTAALNPAEIAMAAAALYRLVRRNKR